MANNFKRSIAMLLVLIMFTGMIPVQALADEGAPSIEIYAYSSESSSSSSSSSSSDSSSSSSSESSSSGSSGSSAAFSITRSSAEGSEGGSDEGSAEGGEPAPTSMEEPKFESQLTTEGGDITVNKGDELKSETTDEDGNTITTVTQTTTTEGTLKGGETISGEETYTETTVTIPDGEEISNEATIEGEETITSENQEITPDDTDLPEVVVTIHPDMEATGKPVEESDTTANEDGSVVVETNTVTNVTKNDDGSTEVKVELEQVTTETEGDVASGNFTETVTTIEREVTANLGKLQIETEHNSDTDLTGLKPKDFHTSEITTPNQNLPKYLNRYHKYDVTDEKGNVTETRWYPVVDRNQEEYDLLPDEIKAFYEKNEETGFYVTTSTDKNPLPAISDGQNWDVLIGDVAESRTGMAEATYPDGSTHTERPSIISVYNKAGEKISTYCMDMPTETAFSVRYVIENLADADYFVGTPEEQEEAKAHVRAAALNGYWGTESGTGSLQYLKDNLKAALNDESFNAVIEYKDAAGSYSLDTSKPEDREKLKSMIGLITDADAIAAMQGAIWSFGRNNGSVNGMRPYSGLAEDDARLELIRSFLISDYLKEKVAADEENQETTIIDRDTFLTKEGITLSVGDKVEMIEDVTENSDSGSSSDNDSEKRDVYEVDISFAMVVEPDPESDNLVVRLIDANGNTVRKARLAGDSSNDDDSFSEVTKNGSTYTFEDLHLAEGTDFMFDLSLEGVQYLEQGVYIYKCTAGYDARQTLVGVAEGEHNVDVSARFTVNFEVTESKSIVATRKWHKTTDPERNPRNDNPPPPARYSLTRGVGQLEIIDEEVPLAQPPQTGDISVLWFAMVAMSGLGLCLMNLLEKKRQQA